VSRTESRAPTRDRVSLEVEVKVLDRRQRKAVAPSPGMRRAVAIALALLSAAAVATLVLIALGGSSSQPRPAPTIAAADGWPGRCLDVTISPSDSSYARADLDRAATCGRFWWAGVAIFRRVAGGWVAALRAGNYACPVRSLPVTVQADLAVCP
jgi:hypothetical protein